MVLAKRGLKDPMNPAESGARRTMAVVEPNTLSLVRVWVAPRKAVRLQGVRRKAVVVVVTAAQAVKADKPEYRDKAR